MFYNPWACGDIQLAAAIYMNKTLNQAKWAKIFYMSSVSMDFTGLGKDPLNDILQHLNDLYCYC